MMSQVKKGIIPVLLVLFLAWVILDDDFEKGTKAYQSGDYATALSKWTPLANEGDARAQFRLGLMYAEGEGVSQDYAEAEKWYRLAAEAGDDDAQYRLERILYVKSTRIEAEAGDAEAQYELGQMYANGDDVVQDDVEAVKWIRLAAEAGRTDAQRSLGQIYEKGMGVSQDDAEAVKWYRLAAEGGSAPAQVDLGFMYEEGRGVEQNNLLAYMWYNVVATLEVLADADDSYVFPSLFRFYRFSHEPKRSVKRLAHSMSPEQVAEARRMSWRCLAQEYKNCE